uniref:Glucosaminyl (N-acetyl) transferase 4 n=1 Tax=Gasterosteus aculeatus aculeatus TaxID=481459 RepID=G3N8J5_GASAC
MSQSTFVTSEEAQVAARSRENLQTEDDQKMRPPRSTQVLPVVSVSAGRLPAQAGPRQGDAEGRHLLRRGGRLLGNDRGASVRHQLHRRLRAGPRWRWARLSPSNARSRSNVDDDGTVALTSDCQTFVTARGYGGVPVSEAERGFPLAYSMVVHKNAPMVERILHAIYAPHNVYCIHYDQKSSPAFRRAAQNLARCLPNVFIASKLESVEYAHISRLNADLNCLSDLLRSEVKWRYVINLCGQDFPLKSNGELVSELKQLNGSNMLESSRPSKLKRRRFSFRHELKNVPYEYRRIPVKTAAPKDAPPHGIEVFIGSAYFVLSRNFVEHVSSSRVAKDFLAWSADTYSPDEHFWASLVRVPGVPGHVARSEADISDLRSKTRLVKWNYLEGNLYPACTGEHMRSVCIYGAAELRWLLNYGHWFANKFDPRVDPVLIRCLEEKLMEKRN